MSTTELDAAVVTSPVEDAVTAPSMHNAQPWRFVHRTGSRCVALFGDPDRTLPYGDPDHRALHADAVMELVHDAEYLEAANEAVRAEIATRTRTGKTGEGPADEGIPADALGPRQYGVSSPVWDFDSSRRVPDRAVADFEKHPQIALLGTVKDTPADWLRAGQAMQRVLLQATLDGLATSLMSQPLEGPELRSSVRDPSSAIGSVHMVFRLGYGPQGAATPRKPVAEVLSFE
ncbi:hypothetical protein EOT10_39435 [Streptomyces antnestii]|uniref:Nitroreductase domain-containing protein n=1 Tax=Streptomyces antnestii TaxID=2494256 RepID=A0A3S2XHV6_9ACTN|nr:nitroreductase family protein [Streptomyces sp. San01]RVU15243.1 hypothetical protein EOT10_39435 [Streptomyces sp. San01]